ncbi:MAG: glutathione S-transferase family protein [Rhodoblastus sp.]|nr:glutathione S-transferase family protein [Rhodoblastus sp.]
MELFTSPMACSLAAHITAYEAGIPLEIVYVDTRAKTTGDGRDYRAIAPNGYVPALRLDDGTLLNENPSVLQYLADRKPEAGLAPLWGDVKRYELIDALNFLGAEVHKKIFSPLFAPAMPAEGKAYAMTAVQPSFDALVRRLGERDHLVGDRFTIADAYLVAMLNWCPFVGVDLSAWPKLVAYHRLHLARPAVAKAIAEEMAERARRAA